MVVIGVATVMFVLAVLMMIELYAERREEKEGGKRCC